MAAPRIITVATLGAATPTKEATLARAKRTARAEARRRYRTQLLSESEADLSDDVESDRPAQRPVPPRPAVPRRVGFRAAFGQAFHPVDFRADLAYLPTLVRERAVIIPVAISLVATLLFVLLIAPRLRLPNAQPTFLDGAGVYLYQIFVWPPPIGAAFLAGFLAKRASWLAGILVTAVGTLCVLASADAFLAIPGATTGTATPARSNAGVLRQISPPACPMGVSRSS